MQTATDEYTNGKDVEMQLIPLPQWLNDRQNVLCWSSGERRLPGRLRQPVLLPHWQQTVQTWQECLPDMRAGQLGSWMRSAKQTWCLYKCVWICAMDSEDCIQPVTWIWWVNPDNWIKLEQQCIHRHSDSRQSTEKISWNLDKRFLQPISRLAMATTMQWTV